MGTLSSLGVEFQTPQTQQSEGKRGSSGSEILDSTTHQLQLDKSNILMLGPTGSGMYKTFSLYSKLLFSLLCYLKVKRYWRKL